MSQNQYTFSFGTPFGLPSTSDFSFIPRTPASASSAGFSFIPRTPASASSAGFSFGPLSPPQTSGFSFDPLRTPASTLSHDSKFMSAGQKEEGTHPDQIVFKYLVEHNNVDAVKQMLADPKVSVWLDSDVYAMEFSCRHGHIDMVNVLLQSTGITDHDFVRPLQFAIIGGHTEVVKLLINRPGMNVNIGKNVAIRLAAQHGHVDIVKLLLAKPQVNPSDVENEAIVSAVRNNHTEVVRILCADPRVDPSFDDNCVIRWAATYGHDDIVKLLLKDPRVYPAAKNNYAIRMASFYGHTNVVRLLLADPCIDSSVDNYYALTHATGRGHVEVVKLLYNANKGTISLDREIHMLKHASKNHQRETVRLWLDHLKEKATSTIYATIKHFLTPATDEMWRNHLAIFGNSPIKQAKPNVLQAEQDASPDCKQ